MSSIRTLVTGAGLASAATVLVHTPRIAASLASGTVGRASDHGWLWLLTTLYRDSGLRGRLPSDTFFRAYDLSGGQGAVGFVTGLLGANLVLAVAISIAAVGALWLTSRAVDERAWVPGASAAAGFGIGLFAELRRWLEMLLPSGLPVSLAGWLNLLSAALITFLVGLVLYRRRDCARRFLWPALAVAITAVAVGTALRTDGGPGTSRSAGRPNVLLISIDSLRRDHLRSYGYQRDTSPVMERLAREGVVFETVVAPTSWTLPSHITMMTGISPETHGVIDDGRRLSSAATTLAEVFRFEGYETAGFVSGPYLRAEYGFYQGFDLYDDYSVELAQPAFGNLSLADESHSWITAPVLAKSFSSWFEDWSSRHRGAPFFAFLHQWDVHYDYLPPPPYDTMFDAAYLGSATGRYEHMKSSMSARDLEHVVALYDGEIRFSDELVDHLISALENGGILDQTIVILTADHGEEFYEHGLKGHRHQLYDESLLVPLVMRYPPSLAAGIHVRQQVRLMDIARTVLGLAKVNPPQGFGSIKGESGVQRGRDLADLVNRAPGPVVHAFGSLGGSMFFLRTGRHKFLLNADFETEELYDLMRDPEELDNIVKSQLELAAEMRAELQSWMSKMSAVDVADRFDPGYRNREQLRALGYLE